MHSQRVHIGAGQLMTSVVGEWRPRDACRLQQALRFTNERFAGTLGAASRTVAKWHANPAIHLTLEMQQALDTMLARSDVDVKERFARLGGQIDQGNSPRPEGWRRRLRSDADIASALDWLDGIRHEEAGTSRRDVESILEGDGVDQVRDRVRARAGLDRGLAGEMVRSYYAEFPDGFGTVEITGDPHVLPTTMLSTPAWLTLRDDLREGAQMFELDQGFVILAEPVTVDIAERALQRVAEIIISRTRFIDAPTYLILTPPVAGEVVSSSFGIGSFARYALTWDLLEAEVADLSLGVTQHLTLRDALLPTVQATLETRSRICVGGAQALCAFARPEMRGMPADFLLLVQERSPRVVNATGRLAVIPKCFHQPINDPRAEVSVGQTLLRELEEELFGRTELEAGARAEQAADPMHSGRLSEPMRWLSHSADWQLQLTGFGFNLMSGNYEFAALMAVHDEHFWVEHGGTIQANWEVSRLRAISSRDRAGIAALLSERGWSDEGLVAFSLGLKRLAELSPERVALPPFEIGVAS